MSADIPSVPVVSAVTDRRYRKALRCLFVFLFQRAFRLIDNRFKCGFVGNGQVGENLAVRLRVLRSRYAQYWAFMIASLA